VIKISNESLNNIETQHITEAWGEGDQKILPSKKINNSIEDLVGN
jgi:hypothetical protein